MRIGIEGEEVTTCGGDGIIVSTPVGSTAYSLSAGGPILSPTLSALIITPICPHLLTLRPLVVSSESHIEIALVPPYPGGVVLTIDGQMNFPLEQDDRVLIARSPSNFYLVEAGQRSFFRILHEKLVWGEARVNFHSE
jgi:NAD+ kinase